MIELKFGFNDIDNAKAFMSGLGKKSKDALEAATVSASEPATPGTDLTAQLGAPSAPTPAPAPAQPAAAPPAAAPTPPAQPATPEAPPAQVPAAAVPQGQGLDMLGLGVSAGELPPAGQTPPAPAAAQPAAPAAPAAPQATTQQQVIQEFVALGQNPAKGPNAIAAVLQELGVATVTAIPADRFDEALQAVRTAQAS